MSKFKTFVIKTIKKCVVFSSRFLIGRHFLNEVVNTSMNSHNAVEHNGCSLKFTTPNLLNHARVDTFSTKEPETLDWIDSIPEGSVLWDIGANVGLYTCYAAKQRNCRVFAFEPSVFNLELLARNIFINNLVEKVTIVPLPLSDKLQESSLNMTSTEWGGALSTFAEDYGDNGLLMDKKFEFSTLGITMNDAVHMLGIPKPDFIKMDVDGIEQLILKAGAETLKGIQGILVEVNYDFEAQRINVKKYLSDSGLVMKSKLHSELIENNERFCSTFNQIWH